jgi:hypothetical protein
MICGFIINALFLIMDLVIDKESVKTTVIVYGPVSLIFIIFFIISFVPKVFEKIFEIGSAFLCLIFGLGTIIAVIESGDSIEVFAITRMCVLLFYITVFVPLTLISIATVVPALFIAFNIGGYFFASALKSLLFSTDYIGLIMMLCLILFSSYIKERELR